VANHHKKLKVNKELKWTEIDQTANLIARRKKCGDTHLKSGAPQNEINPRGEAISTVDWFWFVLGCTGL
jgi:hypothetical protein